MRLMLIVFFSLFTLYEEAVNEPFYLVVFLVITVSPNDKLVLDIKDRQNVFIGSLLNQ